MANMKLDDEALAAEMLDSMQKYARNATPGSYEDNTVKIWPVDLLENPQIETNGAAPLLEKRTTGGTRC